MESAADNLWLFAVAAKCNATSSPTLALLALLAILVWLATALLYWTHPGGPAWGKHWWRSPSSSPMSLPIPGPKGLPFLGSMHLMSGLAHRRLASAASSLRATRLMAFTLGDTRVVVASHPDVAREILHSSAFADRPIKESAYGLMFHRAIGFAPYGVYWRTLRRIAATHLFCPKQIAASQPQRLQIASTMLDSLRRRSSGGGGYVVVRDLLKRASLNNIMSSVFGRVYDFSSLSAEAEELSRLVEEGYELLGQLNWADHLPILSALDPQQIRLRCSKLNPKVNRFVNRIVHEHRARPTKTHVDFVDVLLSLQNAENLTDSDIVAVLWEMVFRGTDTVAVLVEWVLARLTIHQDVQSRVNDELDRVVGRSRPVAEPDVPALVYLQAVVKEVLRLHPPGPLLSWARLAITDTTVDGRLVPAGTTAMVNMWAIARDPAVWARPCEFRPERFSSGEVDLDFSVLGSDLRLAPFGSGRRSCPGKALGLATATFWAASLLHEFAWSAPDAGPVSLSEALRLSCEMASPLAVKLHPRRTTTTAAAATATLKS